MDQRRMAAQLPLRGLELPTGLRVAGNQIPRKWLQTLLRYRYRSMQCHQAISRAEMERTCTFEIETVNW